MKFCFVNGADFFMCKTVMTFAREHEGFYVFDDNFDFEQSNVLSGLVTHGFFGERSYMEKHSIFQQLIPVCIIYDKKKNSVILYQRKGSHTEQRLAKKWTCAFGGHIDPSDAEDPKNAKYAQPGIPQLFLDALYREMLEEAGIDLTKEDVKFKGVLHTPDNPVSLVHLGLVFVLYKDITEELIAHIKQNGSEFAEIKEVKLGQIGNTDLSKYNLELWATIILNKLGKIHE